MNRKSESLRTFSLSRRSLRANPLRSALAVLAVAMATGLLLAASIVIETSNRSAAARERPAPDLEIHARTVGAGQNAADYNPLEIDEVIRIVSQDPAVRLVVPLIELRAQAPSASLADLVLIGAPPEDYAALYGYTLIDGRWPDPAENSVAVSTRLSARLGLQSGGEPESLLLEVNGQEITVTVSGRYSMPEADTIPAAQSGNGPLIASMEWVRPLAGLPEGQAADRNPADQNPVAIEIDLHRGRSSDQTRTRLIEQLGPGQLVSLKTQGTVIEGGVLMIQFLMWAGGGLMSLAAVFVIYNAFTLSLVARRREIGSLRALGMTRRQVLGMVLSEATWTGGIGSLVGLTLGPLLAWGVLQTAQNLKNISYLPPLWGLAAALVTGPVTALVSAFIPAWVAARISPLQAIQQGSIETSKEKLISSKGKLRLPGVAARIKNLGFGIGITIIVAVVAGSGLYAAIERPEETESLGILGLCILALLGGGMLLLPWLITTLANLLDHLGRRAGTGGISAQLASGSLRRGRARAVLTVASMLTGLAALSGILGLFYFWFDLDFQGQNRLRRDDFTVLPNLVAMIEDGTLSWENASGLALFTQPMEAGMVQAIEAMQQDGWVDVIRLSSAPLPDEMQVSTGFGALFVDPEPFLRVGNFGFYQGDAETALKRMQEGGAVLLSSSIAARMGVKVGDEITVPTPHGDQVFEVAGTGRNLQNMNTFSFEDGCRYFDACSPGMYNLIVRPGIDRAAAYKRLQTAVEPYPAWTANDNRAENGEVFERLYGQGVQLIGSLMALMMILASFGMINTMMMNVMERSREIGMLRAVGATRRQVRNAMIYEGVGLGILAALLSILLSFLMLACLVILALPAGLDPGGMQLQLRDFQTALMHTLPGMVTSSLIMLVVAPLISAIAAYFPARRAAETDPATAARSEAMPLGYQPQTRVESRAPLPKNAVLALAWRNLVRNRTRTLLAACAVAMGAATIVASGQVANGIRQTMDSAGGVKDVLSWVPDLLELSMNLVGGVILLGAATLVYNAFAMAVAQRRREIGALRSIGMTRFQVVSMFMLEAAITGTAGALAGLMAGPSLGRLVLFAISGTHVESGDLHFWHFAQAAVMGILIAVLASWIPARRAARLSPLEATKDGSLPTFSANPRQVGESGPAGKLKIGMGRLFLILLLLALWVYLAIAPPGAWLRPPWDVLTMGVFMLAWLAALGALLPWLAQLPAHILQRTGGQIGIWRTGSGVIGRIAATNTIRNPQRLVHQVLMFCIGVAAITLMNGYIYFQNNILFAQLSRTAADRAAFIINTVDINHVLMNLEDMGNGAPPFEPFILERLEGLAEGRALLTEFALVNIPEIAIIPNFPSIMADLDRVVLDEFHFVEGDLPSARAWVAEGCAVLLPPAVAQRLQVHPGDFIPLHGTVSDIQCRVAGTGAGGAKFGGGLGFSQVTLDIKTAFGLDVPNNLNLIPLPGTDFEALRADLETLKKRYPDHFYFVDSHQSLEGSLNTSNKLMSSVNALLLLQVMVAALGAFSTTLIGISERRQELGLLRSVGATRSQVLRMITLESALAAFAGGWFGLTAGVGAVIIYVLTMGGASFGIVDLPLWPSALEAAGISVLTGLAGMAGGMLLGPLAAWLAARPALYGGTFHGSESEGRRGTEYSGAKSGGARGFLQSSSLRTRLMVGTAGLLITVLGILVAFVLMHARIRLEENMASATGMMASLNAKMIEAAVPEGSQNLSLDMLADPSSPDSSQTVGKRGADGNPVDAESLLQMQSLFKKLKEEIFTDYQIADRSGLVLASFDTNQVGDILKDAVPSSKLQTRMERDSAPARIVAIAPVRNPEGEVIGSVRVGSHARSYQDFLNSLGRGLILAGAGVIAVGMLLTWLISTPLAAMTERLSAQAGLARQGIYTRIPARDIELADGLVGRAAKRISRTGIRLQTRVSLVMIGLVVFLLVIMEMITIPSQRREIERMLEDSMSTAIQWSGQAISEMIGATGSTSRNVQLPADQVLQTILKQNQNKEESSLDLANLQEIADLTRSQDMAYLTFVDLEGQVLLSDQFGLIGERVKPVSATTLQDSSYRDKAVWIISTPLYQGKEGPQVGSIQLAFYQTGLDNFINESRSLLRLFGVAALLGAALLAQWIGGAVTAPVRQMAIGAHQVAQGNLDIRFSPSKASSELVTLAEAYNEMIDGMREREWLRDVFGRFVSQEVAEAIRTGQVKLEGENRVVSILFCDIRNFTGRSERSTPKQIVALLNEYLPIVIDSAQEHQGTVNKFGGDSTLVIYGAPKLLPESAYQAVCTAVEMRTRLSALNQRLAARGEEPIRIGVGINTGTVLAGAVGPASRQEYTVIGDTVNLAARIEALNKDYPAYDILISDQTHTALGSRVAEFDLHDLGTVDIRGKSDPVKVWAVVGRL